MVTYVVEVSNLPAWQALACNITNATVSITLPAPDGTPTGPRVVLASPVHLPAPVVPASLLALTLVLWAVERRMTSRGRPDR